MFFYKLMSTNLKTQKISSLFSDCVFIMAYFLGKYFNVDEILFLLMFFFILSILLIVHSSFICQLINWFVPPLIFCLISMNQFKTQIDEDRE
jgi:hypothetical protein